MIANSSSRQNQHHPATTSTSPTGSPPASDKPPRSHGPSPAPSPRHTDDVASESSSRSCASHLRATAATSVSHSPFVACFPDGGERPVPPIASQDAPSAADGTRRDACHPSSVPSPPPSSSSTVAVASLRAEDAKAPSMASQPNDAAAAAGPCPTRPLPPSSMNASLRCPQPSPPVDDFRPSTPTSYLTPHPTPTRHQSVVHVRDLAHVMTLAPTHLAAGDAADKATDSPVRYEISAMPIGDIIEMVAALLSKITGTNDLQHDATRRNVNHQQQANQSTDAAGSQMSPLSHSVLAFHGKNVPAITVLSYLSRIHKYCPTTYEVFLSLLVYFDRMTERINDLIVKSEESKAAASTRTPSSHRLSTQPDALVRDNGRAVASREADEIDSDLADDDDDDDDDDEMADAAVGPNHRREMTKSDKVADLAGSPVDANPSTYFVVDSFNIHRLIISGVTCASKFFSDVFYTNSRYAKVGGLPLAELNHLEIQFLILNDFRLAVPVEDLEAYATMLVEFYARDVVAKK
ncbi:putative PCL7-cyclin like protein interacting with Pho85p [Drechmeria coniospora]|uniref:Putative PCL7-cyclin like protein interacting with Pho85p n=1 Tax=Drechmeria coniospora TaxID=98403 RepID=A0A151GLV1_DRECN|nr:putative PCL7-cyclin like protein interacting with Pho85p [Drechmeria coniospora]KYK58080.1 putative PCL7-cyclin like protein interacting with Pho85p [Drechmeria coniospora]